MRIGIGIGIGFEGGASAPFSPLVLPGLAAWYRADLGISVDGSSFVTKWADQSATGDANKDATATSSGIAVVAADALINNKPRLAFTTKALKTGVWGTPVAFPSTYYLVAYHTPGVSIPFDDLDASQRLSAFDLGDTTFSITSSGGADVQSPPGLNTAVPHVYGCVFASTGALYIDDSQTAQATGSLTTHHPTGLTIGDYSGSGFVWAAIAELIVCSGSHDAATRAKAFAYLGARYGIAAT